MNAYIPTAVISYLLGSIPFGFLLIRIFKREDVRASGSGNIGATNVARQSRVLGVATLFLDAAKGTAAVVIARLLFGGPHPPFRTSSLLLIPLLVTTAAFFAVLGHLFPVWLGFRGGKGVATSLGAFILVTPKSIMCMVILFLIITVAFRYVSLGSIAVAAAFPLLVWAFREYADSRQFILIVMVSALVIWKHRQNIERIAAGSESTIGTKLGTTSGAKSGTKLETKVEGEPKFGAIRE